MLEKVVRNANRVKLLIKVIMILLAVGLLILSISSRTALAAQHLPLMHMPCLLQIPIRARMAICIHWANTMVGGMIHLVVSMHYTYWTSVNQHIILLIVALMVAMELIIGYWGVVKRGYRMLILR
jgi:hypothetical protein